MIVQCPACKTRFSVDSAQLSGVMNPRFHCSRCGHYFELSPQKKAEQLDLLNFVDSAEEKTASISDKTSPPAETASDESISEEISTQTQDAASISELNIKKQTLPNKQHQAALKIDWPSGSEAMPYEADLGDHQPLDEIKSPFHQRIRAHREKIESKKTNELKAEPEVFGNTILKKHKEPEMETEEVSDLSPQVFASFETTSELSGVSQEKPYNVGGFFSSKRHGSEEEDCEEPVAPAFSVALPKSRFLNQYLLLSAAPVLLLLAILLSEWVMTSSQPRSVSVLTRATSGIAQFFSIPSYAPPSEALKIVAPRAFYQKLENGENILLIEGKIKNSSAISSVSDIELSASLYEENNGMLERAVFIHNNSLLENSNLGNLSLAEIKQLLRKSSDTIEIPAKQSAPFRLIFPSPPQGVKWFNVAIYTQKIL